MPRGPFGELTGEDRPPTPPDVLRRYTGVPSDGTTERAAPLAGTAEGEAAAGHGGPLRVMLPPHYFVPPFGALGFYPFTTNPLGPAAVAIYARLQLPAANVGVVRALGVAANTTLLTTDIRAVLVVNGTPIDPIRRIPGQPALYVERVWDDYVYVTPRGATLAVRVAVVDAGGPYTISAYLSGWSLPESDWQMYARGR